MLYSLACFHLNFLYQGKKLAWLEMKLALAKLLLKFDVRATPNTPTRLEYIEYIVNRPKDPVALMLKLRE